MTCTLSNTQLDQLCEYWLTHCIEPRPEPEARLSTCVDLSAEMQRNCKRRGLDVRVSPRLIRRIADTLKLPKVKDRWYSIEFLVGHADDAARAQSWLDQIARPSQIAV